MEAALTEITRVCGLTLGREMECNGDLTWDKVDGDKGGGGGDNVSSTSRAASCGFSRRDAFT